MNQYHKINTIFKREMQNGGKLIHGDWSSPEFEYLANNRWVGTEKIDGTNIRIIYDGINKTIEFKGKTDAADLPPLLPERLSKLFTVDKLHQVFGETSVCLYGEGYGKKIQGCGSRYIKDNNDFILFDIKIGNFWLKYEDVLDLSIKLDIHIVPLIFSGTLHEAIELVSNGFRSRVAEDSELISEGLILKPAIEMFNRKGDRIITKIKYKDFKI